LKLSHLANNRLAKSINRQGLKPLIISALNVTAEAVTYKDFL